MEEFYSLVKNRYKGGKVTKRIIDYFKNFWGITDEEKTKFPTFEECLGILDLAYYRNECFKGYSIHKISLIRNALIFLIAKILDEKLRKGHKNHKKLVKNLKKDEIIKRTAFISLNYDILIDNALVELCDEFHLDYGVDFVNFHKKGDWKKPNKRKSILLLKIHGSLNWLYCPNYICIKLTPKKKER